MTWAEAMREHANAASRDRVPGDANVLRSTPSTSWDPYQVWLSRIKRPRDLAAGRVTADAEIQARRLPAERLRTGDEGGNDHPPGFVR